MKEALVEYVGRRRGKFKIRMEGYPIREWSIAPRANNKERWLPVAEAELWDQQRDWMITRTRVTPDTVAPVSVKLAEPAPPAKRISTLIEEAKEQVQQVVAELAQEAQFCISDSGVVHKEDCKAWPKHPLKMFDTFTNAVNDEDFDRAHKLCCKAELKGKTELNTVLAEVEGSLTQMNTLGESYGIQAAEV